MEKDTSNRKRSTRQPKSKSMRPFQPKLVYQQLHPPSATTANRDMGSSSAQMAGIQGQMQIEMQAQTHMQVQPLRRAGNPVEAELAQEDANIVSSPDTKRPFGSVEDAANRLLPYHVMADYEGEEDETSNKLQQWDRNVMRKTTEFTDTFEKQVKCFNAMSKKRNTGQFSAEERLMLEKAMLEKEEQELAKLKAERDRVSQIQAQAPMQMINPAVPHGIMGLAGFGFRGGDVMGSWATGPRVMGSGGSLASGPSTDGGFNAPNGDDDDDQ